MSYTVQRNASGGWSIMNGCETVAVYDDEVAARLGAAAPDLLDALRDLWRYVQDLQTSNPGYVGRLCLQDYACMNRALGSAPAAIAKAEGRK